MNRLPIAKRAQIIQMLVEGTRLRAISRMADVSINTVTKLLSDVAEGANAYHDKAVRDVRCRRVQCNEIWCIVAAKAKNVPLAKEQDGWGDVWTWTAIDTDTKLCVSYLVGGRDGRWAKEFFQDVADRIRGRVQLTTDGHRAYLNAVEDAFGMDVDYAPLEKIYGVSSERRFTRQTIILSKKVENHAAAVALHFIHYNFARIHKTLRITPAMAAGISDHVWSYEEIAALAA
jgi:hypothetical protein